MYSSLVYSLINSEYLFSMLEVIFFTSATSSYLSLIIKLLSSILIIPWRMICSRVARYLFLSFFIMLLKFSVISALISLRQLFLSFIFKSLAALIFYDLAMFKLFSRLLNFSSNSFFKFSLPMVISLSLFASNYLCPST